MTAVGQWGNGPGLPPQMRRTFEVSMPLATHWRTVTCEVAAQKGMCDHYQHGWRLEFNPGDVDTITQARADLKAAGYRWTEGPGESTIGFVAFRFPPEQNCLRSRDMPHIIPRDRTPILRVWRGDWRAQGPVEAVHTRNEHFAEHLWDTVNALQTKYQEG